MSGEYVPPVINTNDETTAPFPEIVKNVDSTSSNGYNVTCNDNTNMFGILACPHINEVTKMKKLSIEEIKGENVYISFWENSVWPGLGLFGESYILFGIGTMKPLWEILYPTCFVTQETCSATLLNSLSYSVVLGIITGMLAIGTLANTIGRRNGSILTASLMFFGALGLVVSSYLSSGNVIFSCMTFMLFVFGMGVGGEYPLSASTASEISMSQLKRRQEKEMEDGILNDYCDDSSANTPIATNYSMEVEGRIRWMSCSEISRTKLKKDNGGRGSQLILVFAMQGMGIFVQTLSMSIFLAFFDARGKGQNDNEQGYDNDSLLFIFRFIYIFGAAVLIYVLYTRWEYLKESQVWKHDFDNMARMKIEKTSQQGKQDLENATLRSGNAQQNNLVMPFSLTQFWLLLNTYGVRLLGTSLSWMLWDVAFYGNKLFQSTFLLALTGENSSLINISNAMTLNAFVALIGYYTAAYIVDIPWVGRLRLQSVGFILTGFLFQACGSMYESMDNKSLVALYLLSSFFGQCGPNTTTFLISSEIFPTGVRTMCHGISAASGKIGALVAAVLFNHLDDSHLFLISGYCCFLACIISLITIPDTTSLDLCEQDKRWRMIMQGRGHDYVGPAIDPNYLSFYERNAQ
eukprot:CAMPEP_0194414700 /NCGR_PEP_ID=MMETSP0176-20130528/13414_1 /TAXON_ID=216777 /ORGANISM="Proboscia alata, Strain PI-D3" /LENGTH=633 /DNA_ID=CAMNT_0039218899 /DNA_START=18 /DNA_END=1919 /DNA_ORIENTATION=-